MSRWLQCRSPSGWDWFLDARAVLAIEEACWSQYCFVVLSLQRSETSRILVCEPIAAIWEKYYALAPVCDLPRRGGLTKNHLPKLQKSDRVGTSLEEKST